MNPVNAFALLTALRSVLEPKLATLPLPVMGRQPSGKPVQAEGETLRPAALHLGAMPPTAQDALGSVPFVVAQSLGGFDRDGMHHIRVALRVCIVGADTEGAENDLHNLLSLLRRVIIEKGCPALENRFRLVPEDGDQLAPWERPDEQAYPFLQAYILTTWQTKGIAYVSAL